MDEQSPQLPSIFRPFAKWIDERIEEKLRQRGIGSRFVPSSSVRGTVAPSAHPLVGATHTAAGLTVGDVLTATAEDGFAFQTPPAVVSDHGELDGLADDDHTQYLTEDRHGEVDHTGITGCGGSGSGDLVKIAQTVVGAGGASSVTFSSIPSTSENLVVEYQARGAAASVNVALQMRLNGDTASNYDWVQFDVWEADQLGVYSGKGVSSAKIGMLGAASGVSGGMGVGRVAIPAYARTAFRKAWTTLTGQEYAADGTAPPALDIFAGAWRSTSAVTSLTLFAASGDLAEGSVFTIYGSA